MKLRNIVFTEFTVSGVLSKPFKGIDCGIEGDKTNRHNYARIFLNSKNRVRYIHYYGMFSNHESHDYKPKTSISVGEAKMDVISHFNEFCKEYISRMLDIEEIESLICDS